VIKLTQFNQYPNDVSWNFLNEYKKLMINKFIITVYVQNLSEFFNIWNDEIFSIFELDVVMLPLLIIQIFNFEHIAREQRAIFLTK
jgi:hypothetical protein